MDYNENDHENRPRPPGFEFFAKQVEILGKEAGTALRLVWAPEVERFLWGGLHKVYTRPQTATVPSGRYSKHVGWQQGRFEGSVFVPRQAWRADRFQDRSPTGAHLLSNGEWLVPTYRTWEVAWSRWVIEERLPDSERAEHDKHRYEFVDGQLVDALGPYPLGGKWALKWPIAHHFILCCEQANQEHRMCWGQYKAPTDEDLDEIRKAIAARNALPKLHEPGEQPTAWEVAREEQKTLDEMASSERAQDEMIQGALEDVITTGLRARNPHWNPTVMIHKE